LETFEDDKDVWLCYTLEGKSLNSQLFQVKGEFFKGEWIYSIKYQDTYKILKRDKSLLKQLITEIIKGISFLSKIGIVHGDMKPDNILIDFDGTTLHSVKIIDFGSAFFMDQNSLPNFSMNTPEYLAPEVLKHLEQIK